MGMEALFCCFRNQLPFCPAGTGIGTSILSIAFLIWGLADVGFKRTGVKVIYIIAFVLIRLILIAFILALILLVVAINPSSYQSVNNFGRILCLVSIIMCVVAFIFLLVSFIIQLVDYVKLDKYIKDIVKGTIDEYYDPNWAKYAVIHKDQKDAKILAREWVALILPLVISLICLPVMALAANYLYRLFFDRMNKPVNLPVNVTQTTLPTYPNVQQPGIFPNNNGPVPPMGNNVVYPVEIQSGLNLKNN